MCRSGIVDSETKKIAQKEKPTHVIECNPTLPIVFRFVFHEDTCNIISGNLIIHNIKHIITLKQGPTTRYINRVH